MDKKEVLKKITESAIKADQEKGITDIFVGDEKIYPKGKE